MSHDDVLELMAALDGGLREAVRSLALRHAASLGTTVRSTSIRHADDLSLVTIVVELADGRTLQASGADRDAALAALTARVDGGGG